MSIGQATDVKGTSAKTVKLQAAATRAKGDVVRISTGGSTGANVDLTIADNTDVYRVGVCNENAVTGDVYEVVVQGTCKVTVPSATYTVGHGLDILDGAVRDSTAAAEADTGISTLNDFAVILVGGVAVTEVSATLYGSAITGQT